MNNAVLYREHFNLYYIFLEDKQNNALTDEKAAEMFKVIEKRLNGHSPPNE